MFNTLIKKTILNQSNIIYTSPITQKSSMNKLINKSDASNIILSNKINLIDFCLFDTKNSNVIKLSNND